MWIGIGLAIPRLRQCSDHPLLPPLCRAFLLAWRRYFRPPWRIRSPATRCNRRCKCIDATWESWNTAHDVELVSRIGLSVLFQNKIVSLQCLDCLQGFLTREEMRNRSDLIEVFELTKVWLKLRLNYSLFLAPWTWQRIRGHSLKISKQCCSFRSTFSPTKL